MTDKPFKIVDGEPVDLTDDEIAELEAMREQAPAAQWQVVRAQRNAKLGASDWTQLADTPLSGADRALWADYRQALRDITTQTDPFNINWPVEP